MINFLLVDFSSRTWDWLEIGLLKMLVIIALLQLIKKLPDLINVIFKTNIKTQGGIKGRLSEMAGIGGIAANAWSALGKGAKNLGLAALKAPLAGEYLAANALYKKKFGKNLSETKGIRGIKGGFEGLKTAWQTGSLKKSKNAALDAYNKVDLGATEKAKRLQKINEDINNDTTYVGADGKRHSAIETTNMLEKNKALNKVSSNVSSMGGKKVDVANKEFKKKFASSEILRNMKSDDTAIISNLETARNRYDVGSDQANIINQIRIDYETSGNLANLRKDIEKNAALFDPTTLKTLIDKDGKIEAKERRIQEVRDNRGNFSFSDDEAAKLDKGASVISFLLTSAEASAKTAEEDLNIAIAGANLSELDTMRINKYISAEKDLISSMPYAIGRSDEENGLSRDEDEHLRSKILVAHSGELKTRKAARLEQRQQETAQLEAQRQQEIAQLEAELENINNQIFDMYDEAYNGNVNQDRIPLDDRQNEIKAKLEKLKNLDNQ